MKILILGSGGREHAFCWKIKQSSLCTEIFAAPGNAGTAELGRNVDLKVNDFEGIKSFCLEKQIGMVVVGPEDPLVNGIFDFFKNDAELNHIIITGPSQKGAQLEGSKAFSKEFMLRHGIPTARYKEFNSDNYEEGIKYIQNHSLPVVLKADGLAAGKGVLICQTHEEALSEFSHILKESKFGDAGNKVVIEAFLDGVEMSAFILMDGKNYVLLPGAKDYKRIGEGDTGLNTGGMGAISPVPFATDHFMKEVEDLIIKPTIAGMDKDGIDYKGFVFFGLIKVNESPMLIEYNCRMGDPETEVVLLRLKNDLVQLFISMDKQELHKEKIELYKMNAATIVSVSGGYPGDYKKGEIVKLDYLSNPQARKHIDEEGGVQVFHAGTKLDDSNILTNGGRVLAVSSMAETLAESIELSKEILEQIHFEGMYYRKDIGYEFFE
ncbi:MAG: phosphoribosylamine--glycine ligase [Ginsengibacter sp.]